MGKIILHVLAMSSYSGAENVVCQIINMFSEDQNIKMIYCSPEGSIRKVLKEKKIEFEPMEILSVSELKRIIHKIQPDIIHAHDVRATLFSALSCGNITLISHMHNNWENLRKISIKGFFYLFAVRKAAAIIWVSDSAFKQYKYAKQLEKKSVILKNIISVNTVRKMAAENPPDKIFDIVNIGRLMYQKNPERLIEIIEKAVRENPDLKAGLIGNGELSDSIRSLIREKKLESNIKMLGYIDKPLGIVKNAKVFLMASRWEGTPMCVLEALALGVPVVGTPVDGMLDLVHNGENGYLSDDNDVLAKRLLEISSDSELHDRLSKTAIELSNERNSVVDYKKVLERLYEVNISE